MDRPVSDNVWPEGKTFGQLTPAQQKAAISWAVREIAKDPAFHAAVAAVAGLPPDNVEIIVAEEHVHG